MAIIFYKRWMIRATAFSLCPLCYSFVSFVNPLIVQSRVHEEHKGRHKGHKENLKRSTQKFQLYRIHKEI